MSIIPKPTKENLLLADFAEYILKHYYIKGQCYFFRGTKNIVHPPIIVVGEFLTSKKQKVV